MGRGGGHLVQFNTDWLGRFSRLTVGTFGMGPMPAVIATEKDNPSD